MFFARRAVLALENHLHVVRVNGHAALWPIEKVAIQDVHTALPILAVVFSRLSLATAPSKGANVLPSARLRAALPFIEGHMEIL